MQLSQRKCGLDGETGLVRRLKRDNAPRIEDGFLEMLALLDKHLATRPIVRGRACLRRFRLWGQIYEMWTDPTGRG